MSFLNIYKVHYSLENYGQLALLNCSEKAIKMHALILSSARLKLEN